MIESGRECRDVVTQISATSKALEQIGSKLLATGARYCITDEAAAAESGYDIDETAGSDRARRRGGDGARR